ncbi:MAG TPA: hypothetical protein VFK86_15120 [Bauldia sp.]|nr:hypothetical protein [Bauldia sp.]
MRTASRSADGARKREFEAIQKKAKALSATFGESDLDRDGNPIGAWATMLAELDAWAKKHGVKFRTREYDGGGSTGEASSVRAVHACPGTISQTERTDFVGGGHITIKTTCTFRRRTLITRKCVYSCVGEILGFQVD